MKVNMCNGTGRPEPWLGSHHCLGHFGYEMPDTGQIESDILRSTVIEALL